MEMDDKTRTELEAAVFRRLVAHLQNRTDVQNIDMMNLAGLGAPAIIASRHPHRGEPCLPSIQGRRRLRWRHRRSRP